MGTKIAKAILAVLPANTIASLIAEYVTKALQKIDNKEKAALISKAVTETGEAVTACSKAVEDCKVTEDEVDTISNEIEEAVKAIIEAAK